MGFSIAFCLLLSLIHIYMAHSAAFIGEMRTRLLEEKTLLEKELATLGASHEPTTSTEGTATAFPDYGRSEEDNATEVADFETTRATIKAAQERLQEVEQALGRMEQGKYGITDEGKEIPEKRLRANPAATTLVT
jgi:RNA polymerase-binding transcription factor DksA